MYKTTKLLALILSLSLLVAGNAYSSPTTSSKHSSTSHSTSFGSFGSSKKAQTTPAASTESTTSTSSTPSTPSADKSVGFGSFGSGSAATGTGKSTSVLSKNLDQNQAQQNALTTLDARNAQHAGVAGTTTGTTAPLANGTTLPPAQGYPTQPVQTVVYRDSPVSSSWYWFGMGSMFGHHSDTNVYVNGANQQNGQAGYPTNTNDPNGVAYQGQPPKKSGTSWLVVAIWLIIGAALIGLAWSYFTRAKAPAKPSNYSL
ncbi:hypothetical protein [Solimicrobium silvestre]|uniref:Uncharacterized protein n=1 Tax=Solimicrobium silvestre TaxID=2099400 RepID=A0A2S9GX12_9BURK|nr:hypothetical protein [Solimicrobium silvestre]PRC92252.1 hypothetical protein S2091_2911 [Solimicrobium silvestre]